jgi:hypothetical protein
MDWTPTMDQNLSLRIASGWSPSTEDRTDAEAATMEAQAPPEPGEMTQLGASPDNK